MDVITSQSKASLRSPADRETFRDFHRYHPRHLETRIASSTCARTETEGHIVYSGEIDGPFVGPTLLNLPWSCLLLP